ncbi:MAG: hypothetical protein WAN48_07840 [Actinomycetes bacterium]
MTPRTVAVHVWPPGTSAPQALDRLELDFGGPLGDRHHGLTMSSDVRQRWLYDEGTTIRNNRQVSVVDLGELAVVARHLGLAELAPGTIADNVCTSGIDGLSQLAPLSRLVFEGDDGADGAVLAVLGTNNPCTIAGGLVHDRYGTSPEKFPKAAMHRRGVTGWVERPGVIRPGGWIRVVEVHPSG